MIFMSHPIYAADSKWIDNAYDFKNLKRIGILIMSKQNKSSLNFDISEFLDLGNTDTSEKFTEEKILAYAKSSNYEVLSKEQLYQNIAKKTGINLEALSYSRPDKALLLFYENCQYFVDGLVLINVSINSKKHEFSKNPFELMYDIQNSDISKILSTKKDIITEFRIIDIKKNSIVMKQTLSSNNIAAGSERSTFETLCNEFFNEYNKQFKKPNNQDPQNLDTLVKNAIDFLRQNEPDKAIVDLNNALKLDSANSSIYFHLGRAYMQKKDYQKSIDSYNQAIAINPQKANTYYNRGNAYYYLKKYKQAISDYNKAITINSKFYPAYYNRGITYHDLKDYQKAIADYSQSIAINHTLINAYKYRGDAYKAIGEIEKANADFAKVKELEAEKNKIKSK